LTVITKISFIVTRDLRAKFLEELRAMGLEPKIVCIQDVWRSTWHAV
jgi:hypothetical protein